MLKVLDNDRGDNETTADEDAAPTLDELARTGARQMLMTALAVEVAQYVDAHQEARDEQGRRLVVRNGRARTRKGTCGAGTLEVSAPRVHDRRVDAAGQPQQFTCRILPPYMRRSPKVAEVLPILYLRACRRAISVRPCWCCWATTRPASVRPTSRGSRRSGRRTTGGSASGTWPTATTCMSGSTASTATSGSRTTGCAHS